MLDVDREKTKSGACVNNNKSKLLYDEIEGDSHKGFVWSNKNLTVQLEAAVI